MNVKRTKLSKPLEQEQNHRNGHHKGRTGEKVQGLRSITGRYKTDKGRLRVV